LLFLAGTEARAAQNERAAAEEIPIERCDRLPMVRVRIGSAELRFLVDTGATSMLNLKSVRALKEGSAPRSQTKEIEVTSWSGTAATSAREVSIPEFALGNHRLQGLKLPAIDLSPIGKACGGPVDGILGVDLLDRMAVTIDLKRQIASLEVSSKAESAGRETTANGPEAKAMYARMEDSMHGCMGAFEQGNVPVLRECFDPEIVFYTPHGEFVGREKVLEYLQERYFQFVPELRYCMTLHDVRIFGNALWYSYDYSIDTPKDHLSGHGFAMCHRNGQRWQMLNMHNAFVENTATNSP
jgi:hypothetical protein